MWVTFKNPMNFQAHVYQIINLFSKIKFLKYKNIPEYSKNSSFFLHKFFLRKIIFENFQHYNILKNNINLSQQATKVVWQMT